MPQSNKHSWQEAWANVGIGLLVDIIANYIIFPMFGWRLSFWINALVASIYMIIGLFRSYLIRRLFNLWS